MQRVNAASRGVLLLFSTGKTSSGGVGFGGRERDKAAGVANKQDGEEAVALGDARSSSR